MKLALFSIIFLILISINLVVADQAGGILRGEPNTCIKLPQECTSCTYVKLTTITLPDLTQLSIQTNMVQDGTSYSYNFCNTSQIGTYSYCFVGDVDGTDTSACKDAIIGGVNPVQMSIYIFFLLVCLVVTFLSIKLIKNNPVGQDKLDSNKLYEMKKLHELQFYFTLIKRKLWIFGAFGIYLSLFLFITLLNQIVYDLGLSQLSNLLINFVQIMAWGLIPFVLFWIGYLIVFFYKSTEEVIKQEFGRFRE